MLIKQLGCAFNVIVHPGVIFCSLVNDTTIVYGIENDVAELHELISINLHDSGLYSSHFNFTTAFNCSKMNQPPPYR
jgi:hypothetical protein